MIRRTELGQSSPLIAGPSPVPAGRSGRVGSVVLGKIIEVPAGDPMEYLIEVLDRRLVLKLPGDFQPGEWLELKVIRVEPELEVELVRVAGRPDPVGETLRGMGIPDDPRTRQIAEALVRQGLPLTREHVGILLQLAGAPEGAPRENLAAAALLLKANLPVDRSLHEVARELLREVLPGGETLARALEVIKEEAVRLKLDPGPLDRLVGGGPPVWQEGMARIAEVLGRILATEPGLERIDAAITALDLGTPRVQGTSEQAAQVLRALVEEMTRGEREDWVRVIRERGCIPPVLREVIREAAHEEVVRIREQLGLQEREIMAASPRIRSGVEAARVWFEFLESQAVLQGSSSALSDAERAVAYLQWFLPEEGVARLRISWRRRGKGRSRRPASQAARIDLHLPSLGRVLVEASVRSSRLKSRFCVVSEGIRERFTELLAGFEERVREIGLEPLTTVEVGRRPPAGADRTSRDGPGRPIDAPGMSGEQGFVFSDLWGKEGTVSGVDLKV